jgi:hypothetical protein
MQALLLLGLASGAALCLLRFGVIVLPPLIFVVAVGAVPIGVETGQGPHAVIFGIIAAVVSLQIGFVFVLFLRAIDRALTLSRVMHKAIGSV